MSYCCSVCGAAAFHDGRCGDGPVLVCGCDSGPWVNDRLGGYQSNPTGAQAIKDDGYGPKRQVIRQGNRTIIIIDD
jgi:hypothetical protein